MENNREWKLFDRAQSFGYNYTFSLSDIEKVRRQTKKTHNRIKEQLIIITLHGEKIVVEDFACGYFLLKKTIEDEIESSRLEGFDKK